MTRAGVALLALFLSGLATAQAHNPDTSYARILIARERVEVRVTCDLFTLQKIAAVDADHDQRVTRDELQRAAPAIERFLREHVKLEIDGVPAALGVSGPPEWPRDAGEALSAPDWHSAASLIAVPFRQPLAQPAHEVGIAFDLFDALGTRHTVLGSFEYGSQREEITFTQPEPDYLFDLDYAEPGAPPKRTESPLPANLFRFLRLGVEHIFLGYDHICFLLALIVVSRFGELVKIITSFTIAHSITLILATLKVVTLPSRLIECGIALTIVYVAAENLFRKRITHRWMLTFVFGLIHGFGFANVLAQMDLPRDATIRCLLAFNVGVELSQLAIVLTALPLLLLLAKWRYAAAVKAFVSIAVCFFGLGWFVERAFGFGFMPF